MRVRRTLTKWNVSRSAFTGGVDAGVDDNDDLASLFSLYSFKGPVHASFYWVFRCNKGNQCFPLADTRIRLPNTVKAHIMEVALSFGEGNMKKIHYPALASNTT
jgi:hypothetical protein